MVETDPTPSTPMVAPPGPLSATSASALSKLTLKKTPAGIAIFTIKFPSALGPLTSEHRDARRGLVCRSSANTPSALPVCPQTTPARAASQHSVRRTSSQAAHTAAHVCDDRHHQCAPRTAGANDCGGNCTSCILISKVCAPMISTCSKGGAAVNKHRTQCASKRSRGSRERGGVCSKPPRVAPAREVSFLARSGMTIGMARRQGRRRRWRRRRWRRQQQW